MKTEIITNIIKGAVRPSVRTSAWLLRLMLPISLTVQLLQYYGVIEWLATWLNPVFSYLGLPGASAIAFMTAAGVTTYAGLAVMLSMTLTLRQATIIAVMALICHALPLESAVVRKVGSKPLRMALLRIAAAFLAAVYLNLVLPDMPQTFGGMQGLAAPETVLEVIEAWGYSSIRMSAMIIALIYGLMVIQRLMDDLGIMYKLVKPLRPLMRFFGLPENSAYLWLVGNVLGISYGSAAMLALEESGQITKEEADEVNYHLIMNHSMLEDTLVFATQGISALWILSTRILFALALVWGRKLISQRMKYLTLLLLLATTGVFAQQGNPIITHMYSADPSAHVFGDTLWVYPSHDKDDAVSFSMEDYHAYSTTDMVTWHDHGVIFNPLTQTSWAKSAAWAPDCTYRNGKYYLYYPTDKKHIGVAVSDTPYGPFHDPLGHPLLSIDSPGVICDRDFIDPCVFIDDDGQAYLFVGQNTVCCIRLNDDMISYDGEVHIIEGAKAFFEAAWVHKRNGIYYLSYSDGPFRGHEPQIAYCTSTSVLGPYTYQGIILDPVNSGTNHHSIVNYKGQDYLFYHTADLSRYNCPDFHCGVRRSVCVDSLYYNPDGSIQKVRQTINREKVETNTVPRHLLPAN